MSFEPRAADVRNRPLEQLQPGHWWQGDYEDENGRDVQLWAKASAVLDLTELGTGGRFVRVLGTDTTGDRVEITQYRGFAVPSVTARQAEKAGLHLPELEAHS